MSYRSATDRELVTGMRRHHDAAYEEFFRRFLPLLLAAPCRRGAPPDEWRERVTELLDDAALKLGSAVDVIATPLAAYLMSALRHRVWNSTRDRRRRLELMSSVAVEEGSPMERVIATASSEHAARSSRGPDADDDPPSSAVIERLVTALTARLSVVEAQLLAWLAAGVPQQLIAEWLGTTHGALRVRVLRLRRRPRSAATAYAEEQPTRDRDELLRLFRRAGATTVAAPTAAGDRHGTEKQERTRLRRAAGDDT